MLGFNMSTNKMQKEVQWPLAKYEARGMTSYISRAICRHILQCMPSCTCSIVPSQEEKRASSQVPTYATYLSQRTSYKEGCVINSPGSKVIAQADYMIRPRQAMNFRDERPHGVRRQKPGFGRDQGVPHEAKTFSVRSCLLHR